MDDGQEVLRNLHVATFHNGGMKIASLSKRRVTTPVVGDFGGTAVTMLLMKPQRIGTSVWHHREPNTSGVGSSPPLVQAATVLALFSPDYTEDEHYAVNASTLAASTAPT